MAAPLNIGFLFYDFADSRAIAAIRGIADHIGADRVSLFPAGPLNSPKEVAEHNRARVLDALKSSQLDGLITLQFWANEEWFQSILAKHLAYPVVPLLRSFADNPGVTSSYSKGSYEAVSHLLKVHQCTKPYYLSCSSGNSKNLEERYLGYRQALDDCNIPFSEDMRIAFKGKFSNAGFVSDAVLQGNEAVETMFGKRGLIAGKDVDSLVVFNDRMAMEVIEALNKRNIRVPDDIRLISFDNTAEAETTSPPLTTSAIDWYQLGAEGINLLRTTVAEKAVNEVDVPANLIVRSSCGCKSSVERLFQNDFASLQPPAKDQLFHLIANDFQETKNALVSAAKASRDSAILRNAAIMLAKCYNLESFAEAFSLILSFLNLSECSIYLADAASQGQYNRHLHWRGNNKDHQFSNEPVSLVEFSQFMGSYPVSVCESLDQGDRHLGFLLFGANDYAFMSFGELRDLLSNTLHSLLLVEDLQQTQQQLQLVQKEKLTSIGRLVAGVAHDVNTPIGIGVTASSHLVSEAHELKYKFEEGLLSKSAFITAIDNITESSEIVQKNLQRARELIGGFKNVSVRNSNDTVETFALKEQLQDVVFTMKPRLKKKHVDASIDCDENLTITSNPGLLSQIFVNLINNSLKHGFAEASSGKINIQVSELTEDQIKICYQDDGCGMNTEILNKIYEPFFTTKANQGGSGLGMFIVFNMVTQKLGGKLDIRSAPGQGIQVDISLPR